MRGIDKLCWIILCWGIALLSSCCGKMNLVGFSKRTLNPLQFGLNEACTGVDCYYILQRTHKEASRLGVGVSYAGIKEIVLEIPSDAESLPLTQYTDFAGVLLKVKSTQKNIHLFSLTSKSTPVEVEGKEIDNRDFSRNTVMRFGRKMLIVEDKTPWVEKRIGYEQGVTRRDILLVNRGKSKNGPVKSYCTPISHPTCYYCDVDDDIKTIKNICFEQFRWNGIAEKYINLYKQVINQA